MDLSKIFYDKSKYTDSKPKVSIFDAELKKIEEHRKLISGNKPDLNHIVDQMVKPPVNPVNDNIIKGNSVLQDLIEHQKETANKLKEANDKQSKESDKRYRNNLVISLLAMGTSIIAVALTVTLNWNQIISFSNTTTPLLDQTHIEIDILKPDLKEIQL